MEDKQKTILFEETPIPKAVLAMSVPTIISSLVMVIYNLADTYFVGMVNDPVQNAAVALAAPSMEPFVETATVQCAAAVIVTVILVPILTTWAAKKWGTSADWEAKKQLAAKS